MSDIGEADAFGHRHKANIGEALAAEIKARTGIETLASELTYDLRSGEPDSHRLDGRDHVRQRGDGPCRGRPDGRHGRDPGRQVRHTALPDPALGPRKVDVPVMYNATRFRPRYDGKLGDPMLLVGLD